MNILHNIAYGAAALAAVAVSGGFAHAANPFKSPAQFETFYSGLVSKMASWGVQTQRACFTSYCTSYQERTDDTGTMLLGVIYPKDGPALKEFCFGAPLASFGGAPARRCTLSNGMIYDQAYIGNNEWINIQTVASGFGE
jgi:hypothetical protein